MKLRRHQITYSARVSPPAREAWIEILKTAMSSCLEAWIEIFYVKPVKKRIDSYRASEEYPAVIRNIDAVRVEDEKRQDYQRQFHGISSYYNKVVSTPTFGRDKNDLEWEGA